MLEKIECTRRVVRFLALACLLAVSVPAGLTLGVDGQAMAQRGGDSGGGGDGPSGMRSNNCRGGDCPTIVECIRECSPPPGCNGPECLTTTYVMTPVGCQEKVCEPQGKFMRCVTHKASDEKLCTKKRRA